MNGVIRKLKDHLGNYMFPVTSTKCIYGEDGTTLLKDKLNDIDTNINATNTNIGNKSTLKTTDKTSLVNAVNENVDKIAVLNGTGVASEKVNKSVYDSFITSNASQLAGKVSSSEFTKSIATNGWRKLPDGTIEQWGEISMTYVNSRINGNFSTPITFPTGILSCNIACIGINNQASLEIDGVVTGMRFYNNGTFTAYARHRDAGLTFSVNLMWRAIGY